MIVVVGGTGVIGGAIVTALRAAGEEVVVTTRSRELAARPGYRRADMLQPWTLPDAVAGAEVVVQSANFVSYPIERRRRGHTFMAFDGVGTEQLVDAAERAGVRRYVFIAGAGARSGASKPYWEALRRGEDAVLTSRLEGVCIEPTLVFGPRDRGLNRILAFARRSGVVPLVGAGDEQHQPVFVDDVAALVRRTLPSVAAEGAFAIGGPERLSMRALVRRALTAADIGAHVVPIPERLARAGAAVLERLPGEVLTVSTIDFIREDFVADVGPTLRAFPLTLTPLEHGFQTYLSSS
jgi:uncharacterized protein YbjT (DUF2867 family)